MKNKLISWLLSTGLNTQRAELYIAALSRGEASAKDLADDLQLGRTAIYDNLRALEERGYMKTILRGKRKVFVVLNPKELYKKIDNQKQQLKDLLPDFLAMYAEKDTQPFVRLFSGPFAAREVYEDILSVAKKEYVYFSPPQLTLQTVDRLVMEKWVNRRIEKGIRSRSLRVKTKELNNDPIFSEEQNYLRQIRYLPGYIDLKSSIYVYENSIGVISTAREGVAFIINSSDMAFSIKQIFDFLWSVSLKS